MEETQLLFFIKKVLVIIIFLGYFISVAASNKENSSIVNLKEDSMRILEEAVGKKGKDSMNFYIFVSFSLGTHNLARLSEMAARYNGILVLRGMKDNSLPATAAEIETIRAELVSNKVNSSSLALIIDPTLFAQYEISVVPSFILSEDRRCYVGSSCLKVFDKLVGNISASFAIEEFARNGALKLRAQEMMRSAR